MVTILVDSVQLDDDAIDAAYDGRTCPVPRMGSARKSWAWSSRRFSDGKHGTLMLRSNAGRARLVSKMLTVLLERRNSVCVGIRAGTWDGSREQNKKKAVPGREKPGVYFSAIYAPRLESAPIVRCVHKQRAVRQNSRAYGLIDAYRLHTSLFSSYYPQRKVAAAHQRQSVERPASSFQRRHPGESRACSWTPSSPPAGGSSSTTRPTARPAVVVRPKEVSKKFSERQNQKKMCKGGKRRRPRGVVHHELEKCNTRCRP